MSFEWIRMRITEEKERRAREAQIQERLPRALAELHGYLSTCIETFTEAFGPQSATANLEDSKIHVVVCDQQAGEWRPRSTVVVKAIPELPGFQVDLGNVQFVIEVGMLPGDRIFFRDPELDKFLTVEELTRRVLDPAFFPKLKE